MFNPIKWIKRSWRGWEFADAFWALVSALGFGWIVSTVVAVALWFWAYSESLGHLPAALAGLFGFAMTVWILVGLKNLRYKDKPSKTKQKFDFSYGLALEAIPFGRERHDTVNFVQISLLLRNATDYPLQYEVQDISVVIRDRTIADPKFHMVAAVIARGMNTRFYFPRMEGADFGANEKAIIKFTIKYGHPETGFLRCMKQKVDVSLRLDDKPALTYLTLEASDEPIT